MHIIGARKTETRNVSTDSGQFKRFAPVRCVLPPQPDMRDRSADSEL